MGLNVEIAAFFRNDSRERREKREEPGVFRYSIREMLWLTLAVAIACGWWVESARARQWKQRAEIAAGQLEAENMGKMVFEPKRVVYLSPDKDTPFQETIFATDESR